MPDAFDIFRRVSQREREFRAKDFVAPYTQASKVAVVAMSKGMLYQFRISGFNGAGVGIFHPTSPNTAVFVSDAPFDQVRTYLDALPRLHVILSCQAESGWLAFPVNAESAKKRFSIDSPVVVLNVSDAQRFDAITARCDGVNFWYDELFSGGDPNKSEELRAAFEKGVRDLNIKGITPEDRAAYDIACAAWKQFAKISSEQQVKKLLEDGGGRMRSFVIRGKNIEVQWRSSSGEIYNSLVNKDTFDVVSAGICLSGEDTKFHLKDLPHIIEQGEKRSRIVVTRHARNLRIPDEDLDD